MNNTATGKAAQVLIADGLEVNAEIALEEPECPQELDKALMILARKYGTASLLSAIGSAAWGAAETHEETPGDEVVALRLHIFNNRLHHAIAALR